jgi:hypothetical protein
VTSRLLLIVLATACSSAHTNVRWTYVEGARPIDSVVVYTKIQDNAYYGLMQRGMEERLRSNLAACGVEAEFRRGVPEDDDTAVAKAQPTARLTIMTWGGTVVIKENRYHEHQSSSSDVSFKLEVLDHRAGKVTWRAVVDFSAETAPERADGESFANTILSRMRSDGVLACTR